MTEDHPDKGTSPTEAAPPAELAASTEPVSAEDLPHTRRQPNNPLHGVTLEVMLRALILRHDWPGLAQLLPVRCFSEKPSMGSSLKFFRKTPWAREKIEAMYLQLLRDQGRLGRPRGQRPRGPGPAGSPGRRNDPRR